MKKYIICFLMFFTALHLNSCKKFLDVKSITALSGNQYWQSKSDVEAFVNGMYAQLWNKLSGAPFLSATGDQRSGEIRSTYGSSYDNGKAARGIYDALALNDLRSVLDNSKPFKDLNPISITKWQEFYQVIQSANIMYDKVNKSIPGLSVADAARYKAEAVYLRCFAYFFMVRLYGDVAYYTNANQSTPLGRENFVSVLNKCISALKAVKNDLPLKYEETAFNGFRASRGAAIDLLMNMNMWNAGFDVGNKDAYYGETVELGKEIVGSNVYSLLPLKSFPLVMEGGTTEGLFALKQGVDFAVPNKLGFVGEVYMSYPDKGNTKDNGFYCNAYYKSDYLQKIFTDAADNRPEAWFRYMNSNDGRFSLKKFAGTVSATGFPDWAIVVFRYADAVLLYAEAAAELGADGDAINMLNLIRNRSEAKTYDATIESNLKDAIFIERSKELIGEGYHYYDLVRTRRILDANWTSQPLSSSQFSEGGWTWPIDASALAKNPFMTLNGYWQ